MLAPRYVASTDSIQSRKTGSPMLRCLFALLLCTFLADALHGADVIEKDVCVYGGSAGGVMAAVQVARMGKSVVLIESGRHVGGISIDGLGSSDINNHKFKNDVALGGLAKEFYARIGKAYQKSTPVYKFEPHVAESVFLDLIKENKIDYLLDSRLSEAQPPAVSREGPRIKSIRLETGTKIRARVFIDATIEGDLLAAAGVSTIIGREANAKYGETRNGIRTSNTYRQFSVKVDPYIVPGDKTSGVIPTVQNEPLGTPGSADQRIQAYCFRMCLTKNEGNRIPFEKPESYDPKQYEIYLRYMAAGGKVFTPVVNLPGAKTDLGSWHDLSANLYGMNHAYPGGNYAVRKKIFEQHLSFTQGLVYFLANDPQVPAETRKAWSLWGVCKDEFADNAGWPRQFYVRDARRMVSDYVITERNTVKKDQAAVADPVGVAYWPPDTHHVRRIIQNGACYNEGFVFGGDDWAPFSIAWRALIPKRGECINLITPTCPSSSHIAYGAIRLEWTYMVLGQSAGTAAVMALEKNIPVQDVNYDVLRKRLKADGQVLQLELIVPAKDDAKVETEK